MSATLAADNIALAQRFYDARGDRAVIAEVMTHDVVWDITPGFPHGGIYHGVNSVLGFLAAVGEQFSAMGVQPERFLADGDGHVIVLGHYAATGANGQSADARFIHVWTIQDGKLARLDQTADTQVLAQLRQS